MSGHESFVELMSEDDVGSSALIEHWMNWAAQPIYDTAMGFREMRLIIADAREVIRLMDSSLDDWRTEAKNARLESARARDEARSDRDRARMVAYDLDRERGSFRMERGELNAEIDQLNTEIERLNAEVERLESEVGIWAAAEPQPCSEPSPGGGDPKGEFDDHGSEPHGTGEAAWHAFAQSSMEDGDDDFDVDPESGSPADPPESVPLTYEEALDEQLLVVWYSNQIGDVTRPTLRVLDIMGDDGRAIYEALFIRNAPYHLDRPDTPGAGRGWVFRESFGHTFEPFECELCGVIVREVVDKHGLSLFVDQGGLAHSCRLSGAEVAPF